MSMRENIGLYRGKLKDNNEWVYWNIYGEFTAENGKRKKYTITKGTKTRCYYYIYQLKQAIIPESIGQYVGKTDMNRKKIFEGDIVQILQIEYNPPRKYGKPYQVYRNSDFPKAIDEYYSPFSYFTKEVKYEIIGNITDNPELLKGGAEE